MQLSILNMKQFEFEYIYKTQKGFGWHNEDAWGINEKYPIYAVADGVTLRGLSELFHPSGSKPAADIFCECAVKTFEKNYAKLSKKAFRDAYSSANKEIGRYIAKNKLNISAVAALVAVRNGKIFGSRLTDCGFALIRGGKIIFKTPEYWSWAKKNKIKGYGVLDGKAKNLKYIDFYELAYAPGDILALFTDGFENHFSKKGFIASFKNKNFNNIEESIKTVDLKLVAKNPEKFGHERTLLIVQLT